jgi:hypothetical protein
MILHHCHLSIFSILHQLKFQGMDQKVWAGGGRAPGRLRRRRGPHEAHAPARPAACLLLWRRPPRGTHSRAPSGSSAGTPLSTRTLPVPPPRMCFRIACLHPLSFGSFPGYTACKGVGTCTGSTRFHPAVTPPISSSSSISSSQTLHPGGLPRPHTRKGTNINTQIASGRRA